MKEYVNLLPGVKSRLVACNNNLIVIENIIEAKASVPQHSHESAQITVVLDGSLLLGIEGAGEKVLRKGDYVVIPPRTSHWATTETGAVVLDINAPFTEDRRVLVEKLGGCKGL